MIFSTCWFLAFAALSVGIFWLLPGPRLRLTFPAGACGVFHTYFAGPAGVVPILVLAVITYPPQLNPPAPSRPLAPPARSPS